MATSHYCCHCWFVSVLLPQKKWTFLGKNEIQCPLTCLIGGKDTVKDVHIVA